MAVNFHSYFLIIDTEALIRCVFLLCLTNYLACIQLYLKHINNNKWAFITLCLGRDRKSKFLRQNSFVKERLISNGFW